LKISPPGSLGGLIAFCGAAWADLRLTHLEIPPRVLAGERPLPAATVAGDRHNRRGSSCLFRTADLRAAGLLPETAAWPARVTSGSTQHLAGEGPRDVVRRLHAAPA
jgi:hypothetical protein